MDKTELEYLAKLSKIELNEEEAEEFFLQLNKILEYMNILAQVDVENVQPFEYLHPDKTQAFLRKDLAEAENILEKSSLHIKDGYFISPKII